jgi:hypothetical protein
MKSYGPGVVALLVALCLASDSFAQNGETPTSTGSAAPTNAPVLTGKERTGRKWMDEQRIDNCNVPADKRGSKPRPNDCLHSPSG